MRKVNYVVIVRKFKRPCQSVSGVFIYVPEPESKNHHMYDVKFDTRITSLSDHEGQVVASWHHLDHIVAGQVICWNV